MALLRWVGWMMDQDDWDIWFGPLGSAFNEVRLDEAREMGAEEEPQNSHFRHRHSELSQDTLVTEVLKAAENTSGVRIMVNLGVPGGNLCVEIAGTNILYILY